jgi:hypothetical protein
MKSLLVMVSMLLAFATFAQAAGDYRGDERCPLPTDWSKYSEPYEPLDHPGDYPTFYKADWPGWSCSYQREDGVIVQYGDSRTPQEQWQGVWGGSGGDMN